MIITVFPGQGSQTPGFLSPWLDLPGVRERLEEFSAAAGVDLVAAGTVADADEIRDTSVAQPLIVAASLVSYDALTDAAGVRPGGVAGHSVGEIAALVAAGVVTAEDGMRLVGLRGRAMAEAASREATGMAAVLGGDRDAVLDELVAHLAGTAPRLAVLYIDLHLIHEVTSPQAFTELRARGLAPRSPDRTQPAHRRKDGNQGIDPAQVQGGQGAEGFAQLINFDPGWTGGAAPPKGPLPVSS